MLRDVKCTQLKSRLLVFKLTGTGTAELTEGKYDATLVDNGTGDYTLTFTAPFAANRNPAVIGAVSRTAAVNIKVESISPTALNIKTFAVDGTTAKDALLDIAVMGWDTADQY